MKGFAFFCRKIKWQKGELHRPITIYDFVTKYLSSRHAKKYNGVNAGNSRESVSPKASTGIEPAIY